MSSTSSSTSSIIPGTLTRRQLLDSPLPVAVDHTSSNSSSSRVDMRREPVDVRSWMGFTSKLQQHREEMKDDVLDSGNFVPMPVPRLGYHFYDEGDLQRDFMRTAGDALCQLFDDQVMTTTYTASGLDHGFGLLVPDFLSKSLEPLLLLAVGENKRHNLTTHGTDLISLYKVPRRDVQDAIWQLTGYHWHYDTKYGFVSTYEYCWASYLDSNGVLYLSPVFNSSTAGRLSVISMMEFVISIALHEATNKEGSAWQRPNNLIVPQGAKVIIRSSLIYHGQPSSLHSSQLKASCVITTKTREHDENDYTIELLSKLPHRAVWRLATEDEEKDDKIENQVFVLKGYSDEGSREHEVMCYKLLHKFEGLWIPRLINDHFDLNTLHTINDADSQDTFARYPFGLIISWIGPLLGGHYRKISRGARRILHKHLETMHSLGVAHTDLRADNIYVDTNANQVWIYDFSHAVLRVDVSSEQFAAACDNDFHAIELM